MINLGAKIRELRKKKGITQEQMANALKITAQAVSKWESDAGYPDVATLPVIAAYFGVSLDELFDYDPEEVEEKVQKILFKSRVEAHTFEEREKILLEGLELYPGGDILKRELLERYAGQIHAHGRTDLTEKALSIGKQLVAECKDSFIYLGAMGDMADIYITSGRYEEGKKLIESMPYRYHLDIYDRMRCTVMFLKCEDALHEAREWKRWAHQELKMVCDSEGICFFETGDYENALHSFEEAAFVIERFWQRDIPKEYALLQSDPVRAFSVIRMAACLYKLGRLNECDKALDEAYHILRNGIDDEIWEKYSDSYIRDYRNVYTKMGLDEYKPCKY